MSWYVVRAMSHSPRSPPGVPRIGCAVRPSTDEKWCFGIWAERAEVGGARAGRGEEGGRGVTFAHCIFSGLPMCTLTSSAVMPLPVSSCETITSVAAHLPIGMSTGIFPSAGTVTCGRGKGGSGRVPCSAPRGGGRRRGRAGGRRAKSVRAGTHRERARRPRARVAIVRASHLLRARALHVKLLLDRDAAAELEEGGGAMFRLLRATRPARLVPRRGPAQPQQRQRHGEPAHHEVAE